MYMYKDGSKILVDRSQISEMEAAGWTKNPEAPVKEDSEPEKDSKTEPGDEDSDFENDEEGEDSTKPAIRKPRKIGKK